MISDERLEKALRFRAETDQRLARYYGLWKGLEDNTKVVYAQCFMDASGSTIKEREMLAYMDERYIEHIEKLNNARTNHMILATKRSSEEHIVEVWRTLQANLRRGNI